MTHLGDKLRERRKAQGETLDAVAIKAKIAKGHLSNMENGHEPNPQLKTLFGLGKALKINPIFLAEIALEDVAKLFGKGD